MVADRSWRTSQVFRGRSGELPSCAARRESRLSDELPGGLTEACARASVHARVATQACAGAHTQQNSLALTTVVTTRATGLVFIHSHQLAVPGCRSGWQSPIPGSRTLAQTCSIYWLHYSFGLEQVPKGFPIRSFFL